MKFPSFNRFSLKICGLIMLLAAIFTNGYAQQPSKYSLLWEISGNGLKQPSFLFGSMHLKDKRIFNFSDSVMKAMQASTAFVMEVHPDSINKSFFDEEKEDKVQRDVLKILSPEQLSILFKRFKEKNGFDADTATLNNPMLISSLMKADYAKPDDMPAFVDAYLLGIARTLRKKIFGLEKIQDQIDLLYDTDEDILALFEDNEAEKEYVEEMISVYARGNSYEIYDFLKDEQSAIDDSNNLIARNKVMVAEMKELMKNEIVFTTIGAAHLLGDEGVIALLRKAGYHLRPVTATFTGVAKNYQIDYAKMDWHHYKDPSFNFTVDFPSVPARKYEKGSSAYVVYSDLANEVIFTTTASFTGPIDKDHGSKYLDTVAKSYLESDHIELISKNRIVKDGVPAMEIFAKTKNKYVRTLIQYNNNQFFTVSIEGAINNLNDYYANHFIESFHSTKPIEVSANNWINYKNEAAAFSIRLPLQPEEVKKEVPNPNFPAYPYQIYMYHATDQVKLINYIVRYNDFPAGLYLADLPAVFATLEKQFEGKAEIISGPRKIKKDGYEGRVLEMILQGFHMEVQMFVRGNRTYMLLKQNLNGPNKPAEDQFFSSFKFENYIPLKTVPFELGNLKLQLPSNPVKMPNTDDVETAVKHSSLYYAVNKNTGGVYGVESSTFSKYVRYKHPDSLYHKLLEGLKGETDSLINVQDAMVGNIKAKIYTAKDTLAGTQRKIKIWVDRNYLYSQTILASPEEMGSKQGTDFFNLINYQPNAEPFDLFSSKAALIFNDLKSTDTTIFKPAFGALSYYEFEKEELPTIYKALKLSYADDSTSYGIRGKLINTFQSLKNETTIPFLKELFEAKNPAVIRAKILGKIPMIDSTQYDWYLKKLITSPPFKVDEAWALFKPLRDSIPYTAKHFDELLPLMEDEDYRTQLLNLTSQMLNEEVNRPYVDLIKAKREILVAKAIKDLEGYITKSSSYPTNVYAYLNILTHVDMPKLTDEFTNKVFKLDSATYMHTTALATRIKTKLPLDQQILSAQLDSLSTRFEIMKAYDEIGKINEVPLKYRKQEEFAKLLIYNYLVDADEDLPEAMKLLGKIKHGDSTYYAFEIVYNEEGSMKRYLAFAGAFDEKQGTLDFKNNYGYMDWDELEEDWEEQVKTLIEAYKNDQ